MSRVKYIYKIFTSLEWQKVKNKKIIEIGSQSNDIDFVHLSTKKQVAGTIKKYYSDEENLVIIKLKVDDIKDILIWEKSRNNEYFPHCYGCFPTGIILDIKSINNE
tara:strand:- start:1297 stop:1614 length:318 start_codon:yes stop_codon:yes gene_type:complete